MGEQNRVGLVAFDTSIVKKVAAAPLWDNRRELRSAIREMVAGGSTALYDALKEAVEIADRDEGVTDGEERWWSLLTGKRPPARQSWMTSWR